MVALIQTCSIISLLCGAWNLYGDIYYLDHYMAHMSMDDADGSFAMINRTYQSGNIFDFDNEYYNPYYAYFAQAGGWMYPAWAMSTAIPLYIGLKDCGSFTCSALPCILMVYGLCIIGGSLHSAFAFLTVISHTYHHNDIEGWQKLVKSKAFDTFVDETQSKIVEHFFVGASAGYVLVNLASAWIGYIVLSSRYKTMFPRWVLLFHPFVTIVWVSAISYLLPDPWGFYVVGSMGTWGVSILNIGTTLSLRNNDVQLSNIFSSGTKED